MVCIWVGNYAAYELNDTMMMFNNWSLEKLCEVIQIVVGFSELEDKRTSMHFTSLEVPSVQSQLSLDFNAMLWGPLIWFTC